MQRIPVVLKSKDELSLIKQYLHLTKSVHGLTDRQIEVVAVLIKDTREENGELHKVLSSDGRALLRDVLDMSQNSFDVMISRLRRKGVITNNKLSPAFNALRYDQDGCIISFNLQLHAEEN